MKNKVKHTLVYLLLLCSGFIYAQTITGVVTDDFGPIPGVNVLEKGTTNGVTTDIDGRYTLNGVSPNAVLVFSYVGFATQEIPVNNQKEVNVTLQEEAQSLDQIVLTGSSNPKKKIESSVAITTLKAGKIEERAPTSTADILQYVPGFLVENSGGEVGNNLFARGIPSAGAYEFVQIQEDGLPVFEDGALQFANADNWYRLDENIRTVEAVRGGSASIFANNAPGGIVNFITKTGQNETEGRVKLTVGDYGLFRTDLNVSGAVIEDKLFFNIGGFYRVDDGIRDPGFKANNGGQVKLNLTYQFDKGYVRVHYKKLDDRNIFYLPIPLRGDSDGRPEEFPGFDANYGTLTSRNFTRLRVPQVGGGFFSADLEDGVHPNVDVVGGEIKYDISDKVRVKNTFKNTDINLDYNAIFSTGGPSSQDGFATGVTQFRVLDQNAVFNYATANPIINGDGSIVPFSNDTSILASAYAANFVNANPAAAAAYANQNAQYTYVDNGEVLNPNALIMRADHWFINKQMNNFANNLAFTFDLNNVDLTLGYYYSNWKSNQYWNWSNYLVDVSDNPRLVNLEDTSTGVSRTWNGIERITWLERDAQTKGTLNDLYLDAEIEFNDKLNGNVGIRYNSDRYSGYRDNAQFFSTDLGFLDNNTADDAITVVAGNPYTYWDYDVDEVSYTAALNYKFNNHMATYGRFSKGFRAPIEETYYNNAADLSAIEVTKVNQTELGFKYSKNQKYLNVNLFYMNMKNIPFADILANGTSENRFADVNNFGIELEAGAKFDILTLEANATLQDPKYDNFTGTNADGSTFDYDGNTARRIPNFYFTLRPSVDVTKDFNIYTQWSFFGRKYTNENNLVELPSFSVFNAGASYKINNLRFALDASNLFNSIGLTEGNPRQTTSASDDVFLARPILGRAIKLSVALDF